MLGQLSRQLLAAQERHGLVARGRVSRIGHGTRPGLREHLRGRVPRWFHVVGRVTSLPGGQLRSAPSVPGKVTTMTNEPRGTRTPMDVFEAVRTLLAVRSYKGTPIPDAVVRRIVEAGRLTGSGMNGQPWHFIVVRDRTVLSRLGELAPSGRYVAEAPLAIVVIIAVAIIVAVIAVQIAMITPVIV